MMNEMKKTNTTVATTKMTTETKYSAPLYKVTEETATLHISQGNSKVGKEIYTFSTLPGNMEHMLVIKGKAGDSDQLLTDIHGTCSKYCDTCFNGGCYAVNSARLHHNAVIQAWAENTLLLRSGRIWAMIDEFISKKNLPEKEPKVKIWRINVSGELESVNDIRHWDELAAKHPEVRFSVYTKNYDAVEKYMQELEKAGRHDTQPNFIINISQWHHCADAFLTKYPKNSFNVFTYDDSNRKSCGLDAGEIETLSKLVHCPAVTKSGKHAKKPDGSEITCSECQRCYKKTGAETAVYAH